MVPIPAAALLEAWERGRDVSPGERGLILLGVAHPETPAAALAEWPVGRRDAALLALLERTFGSGLSALAECPRCHEPLEMDLPVSAIRVPAPQQHKDRFVLDCTGYRVTYRLPTAGDLAALGDLTAPGGTRQAATRWLLERCIVDVELPKALQAGAESGSRPAPAHIENIDPRSTLANAPAAIAADMPDAVFETLASAMAGAVAAADPQAEIELALTCPACRLQWRTPFDIVNFLWDEIDRWAARILGEVHILASNYGWSERDILALHPGRRQYYLDLVGL
jgi:hypothetical protein